MADELPAPLSAEPTTEKIIVDPVPRALRYPDDSPEQDFWLLAEPAYEPFEELVALRIERALAEFGSRVRAQVAEEIAQHITRLMPAAWQTGGDWGVRAFALAEARDVARLCASQLKGSV